MSLRPSPDFNIRSDLMNEVLIPKGHSNVQLDEMLPTLSQDATERMQKFAQENLKDFPLEKVEVSFPWNRMFEIDLKVQ